MRNVIFLAVLAASNSAFAVKSRPEVFSDYLDSEKMFQMPADVSSENVKQGTRKLLTAVVSNTQLPSKGWKPEDWNLDFTFPSRRASSEEWVSLSEASYLATQNSLRNRYDELRKKVSKDSERQELFTSFLLARAVVADSFRTDFLKFYKSHYPALDPKIFESL